MVELIRSSFCTAKAITSKSKQRHYDLTGAPVSTSAWDMVVVLNISVGKKREFRFTFSLLRLLGKDIVS